VEPVIMVILNSLSGLQLTLRSELPLAASNSRVGPSEHENFRSAHLGCQPKTTPTTCGIDTILWKFHKSSNNPLPAALALVTLSHPLRPRKEFPSPYVVEVRTAKFQNRTLNGGSYAK